MTLFAYVAGVELGSVIRLRGSSGDGISGLTASADGTGSQGGIIFDDPAKSLTITGWQSVVVNETDCSQPRLFTGYMADRTTSRGPFRTTNGRIIDATINDPNVLLSLRLITGPSGKRPVETDLARITWLLSTYLSGIVFDVGWITASSRSFQEADYTGQYAADVLASISEGKIFFAQWDPVTSKVGLFYNDSTSYTSTSTLTISNVLTDVDNVTCFAPNIDAVMTQDPSEVYSRLRFVYLAGILTTDRAATATAFFPSPLDTRGVQVEHSRISVPASAQAWSDAYLLAHSIEDVIVTCTVILPSTKVGLVDAGQRISVRFQHLDGFESFTYARVAVRTIRPVPDNEKFYEVDLTLNTRPVFGGSGGEPPPSGFPHPPAGAGSLVQSSVHQDGGSFVPSLVNPTNGNLLYAWMTSRTGVPQSLPSVPTGWSSVATAVNSNSTFGPGFGARLVTKTASGDTAASILVDFTLGGVTTTFMEFYGVTFGAEVHVSDANAANASTVVSAGGSITPSAANALVVGCAVVSTFNGTSVTPDSGVTELGDTNFPGGNAPNNWVGYKTVATPVSTIVGGNGASGARNEYGGVTFTLIPSATASPPPPGQWVYNEAVTLTAGAGTTVFPFADGALRVRYDIIDQTPAIVSYNGATGAFTMPSQPPLGTQVFVDYQGR